MGKTKRLKMKRNTKRKTKRGGAAAEPAGETDIQTLLNGITDLATLRSTVDSTDLKGNKDFVLAVLTKFPELSDVRLIHILPVCGELCRNSEFMLEAIKETPEIMQFAEYDLLNDEGFVEKAYKINRISMKFLDLSEESLNSILTNETARKIIGAYYVKYS